MHTLDLAQIAQGRALLQDAKDLRLDVVEAPVPISEILNRTQSHTNPLMLSVPTFSVQDAANILSVHPETLRRLIREGKIQATRAGAGKKSLLTAHALDLYVRRQGGAPIFPNLAPQAWAILQPEDGFEKVYGIGLTEEQAWKDADQYTDSRAGLRAYPASSDLYEGVLSRGSVAPRILSGPLADVDTQV
jgi:excisionase family DNA binding protein